MTNLVLSLFDIVLHVDKYLILLINQYGILIYLILFLIVFCETGLVFTPFLPGDSLIFTAGALASSSELNLFLLFFVFVSAAIIGDSVNYLIGTFFGKRLCKLKWCKGEYIAKTEKFYEEHGGKAIIFARFVPIVRTFAPFVAGIGKMKYSRFFFFNIIGGLIWVISFLVAGYYFGAIPIVQENLTIFVIVVIIISIIPPIWSYLKIKLKKKSKQVSV